jgi:hypothetical protein
LGLAPSKKVLWVEVRDFLVEARGKGIMLGIGEIHLVGPENFRVYIPMLNGRLCGAR